MIVDLTQFLNTQTGGSVAEGSITVHGRVSADGFRLLRNSGQSFYDYNMSVISAAMNTTREIIRIIDCPTSDTTGLGMLVGADGLTVVGSGESHYSITDFLVGTFGWTPPREELVLASDNSVYIVPSCQSDISYGWNRRVIIGPAGIELYCPFEKSLAASSDIWAGLTFSDLNGSRAARVEIGHRTVNDTYFNIFVAGTNSSSWSSSNQGGLQLYVPANAAASKILRFNINSGTLEGMNSIELQPSSGVGHGGFIDFHFSGSTVDYTSRIIEAASGRLEVLGAAGFCKRGSGANNGIWAIAMNMTRDESLTTLTDAPAFVIGDKNLAIMGRVCVRHQNDTNNTQWCMLETNRYVNGTSYWNTLSVGVTKTGALVYSVNNAANFRSAIGAAASSDRRLKTDIALLGRDAVEFVESLKPSVYTINGERQVGLIAQDVHDSDKWGTRMAFETQEGIDGLDDWEKMDDGSPTWKLDYIRIIPPLTAALQHAMKRISELEKKIDELTEAIV